MPSTTATKMTLRRGAVVCPVPCSGSRLGPVSVAEAVIGVLGLKWRDHGPVAGTSQAHTRGGRVGNRLRRRWGAPGATSLSALVCGHEQRERIVAGLLGHHGAAESAHLLLRGDRLRIPSVLGEPVGDVGTVGVVVGQLRYVERVFHLELRGDAGEPLAHLLTTLVGMRTNGLGRDATARCRELRDLFEPLV